MCIITAKNQAIMPLDKVGELRVTSETKLVNMGKESSRIIFFSKAFCVYYS